MHGNIRDGRPTLADLLDGDGIIVAPGAYDVLSAMIVERTGFSCVYMTGNGQTSSALGFPDVGMIGLAEMAERIRATAQQTTVPLIADADVGYGSLLMTQRAVREFEAAGAAAIQIEDQLSPKKCGHEPGRILIAAEDMVARVRAACDARRSSRTLIVARCDARTTHGLDEALRRGKLYADAGADVIFIESPESEEELARVAREIPVPALANMVETGRTPYLSGAELERLGFRVAIYPATGFLAATGAVAAAMAELKETGLAAGSLERMWTLQQYHDFLSFSDYVAREEGFRAVAQAEATARATDGTGGDSSGSAG
jgi:2-methylisocitrate lyase-like PEP mutase family enzyme